MKKLSLIVASVVLAGVAAHANPPVYSQNGVGYVSLSLPSGFSMISVPFNRVGGDALSLDEAFGSNIEDGTTVFFYTGTGYKSYTFTPPDGWLDNDDFSLAGTNKVLRGEGMWIQVITATNLVVTGEIPGAADATNDIPLVQNFQMVSFAYPTPKELASSGIVPEDGDTIFRYTGSGYKSATYTPPDGWLDNDTFGVTNIVLNIGQGYWYQSVSAKDWTQVKPYVWP